jgi:hypothetical protein
MSNDAYIAHLKEASAKLESAYAALKLESAAAGAAADLAERRHGAFSPEARAANDLAFDLASRLCDVCLEADEVAADLRDPGRSHIEAF